ncbi:MAG: hypothetical protein QGH33_01100 [Pirellulaceae bacterium]|nr:hypothetical protein [Pirellulaceae bacterium]
MDIQTEFILGRFACGAEKPWHVDHRENLENPDQNQPWTRGKTVVRKWTGVPKCSAITIRLQPDKQQQRQ